MKHAFRISAALVLTLLMITSLIIAGTVSVSAEIPASAVAQIISSDESTILSNESSLHMAIAGLQDGQTIRLVKDIRIGEASNATNMIIGDKLKYANGTESTGDIIDTIVIDLNGKTISVESNSAHVFYFQGKSSVIIKNGTIALSATNDNARSLGIVSDDSNVVVNNVTFKLYDAETSNKGAVAGVTKNDGKLTLVDCKVDQSIDYYACAESGVITLNGGEYYGQPLLVNSRDASKDNEGVINVFPGTDGMPATYEGYLDHTTGKLVPNRPEDITTEDGAKLVETFYTAYIESADATAESLILYDTLQDAIDAAVAAKRADDVVCLNVDVIGDDTQYNHMPLIIDAVKDEILATKITIDLKGHTYEAGYTQTIEAKTKKFGENKFAALYVGENAGVPVLVMNGTLAVAPEVAAESAAPDFAQYVIASIAEDLELRDLTVNAENLTYITDTFRGAAVFAADGKVSVNNCTLIAPRTLNEETGKYTYADNAYALIVYNSSDVNQTGADVVVGDNEYTDESKTEVITDIYGDIFVAATDKTDAQDRKNEDSTWNLYIDENVLPHDCDIELGYMTVDASNLGEITGFYKDQPEVFDRDEDEFIDRGNAWDKFYAENEQATDAQGRKLFTYSGQTGYIAYKFVYNEGADTDYIDATTFEAGATPVYVRCPDHPDWYYVETPPYYLEIVGEFVLIHDVTSPYAQIGCVDISFLGEFILKQEEDSAGNLLFEYNGNKGYKELVLVYGDDQSVALPDAEDAEVAYGDDNTMLSVVKVAPGHFFTEDIFGDKYIVPYSEANYIGVPEGFYFEYKEGEDPAKVDHYLRRYYVINDTTQVKYRSIARTLRDFHDAWNPTTLDPFEIRFAKNIRLGGPANLIYEGYLMNFTIDMCGWDMTESDDSETSSVFGIGDSNGTDSASKVTFKNSKADTKESRIYKILPGTTMCFNMQGVNLTIEKGIVIGDPDLSKSFNTAINAAQGSVVNVNMYYDGETVTDAIYAQGDLFQIDTGSVVNINGGYCVTSGTNGNTVIVREEATLNVEEKTGKILLANTADDAVVDYGDSEDIKSGAVIAVKASSDANKKTNVKLVSGTFKGNNTLVINNVQWCSAPYVTIRLLGGTYLDNNGEQSGTITFLEQNNNDKKASNYLAGLYLEKSQALAYTFNLPTSEDGLYTSNNLLKAPDGFVWVVNGQSYSEEFAAEQTGKKYFTVSDAKDFDTEKENNTYFNVYDDTTDDTLGYGVLCAASAYNMRDIYRDGDEITFYYTVQSAIDDMQNDADTYNEQDFIVNLMRFVRTSESVVVDDTVILILSDQWLNKTKWNGGKYSIDPSSVMTRYTQSNYEYGYIEFAPLDDERVDGFIVKKDGRLTLIDFDPLYAFFNGAYSNEWSYSGLLREFADVNVINGDAIKVENGGKVLTVSTAIAVKNGDGIVVDTRGSAEPDAYVQSVYSFISSQKTDGDSTAYNILYDNNKILDDPDNGVLISISDCNIYSDGFGIYQPNGSVTVAGSYIFAGTGIYMQNGYLNLNDGQLIEGVNITNTVSGLGDYVQKDTVTPQLIGNGIVVETRSEKAAKKQVSINTKLEFRTAGSEGGTKAGLAVYMYLGGDIQDYLHAYGDIRMSAEGIIDCGTPVTPGYWFGNKGADASRYNTEANNNFFSEAKRLNLYAIVFDNARKYDLNGDGVADTGYLTVFNNECANPVGVQNTLADAINHVNVNKADNKFATKYLTHKYNVVETYTKEYVDPYIVIYHDEVLGFTNSLDGKDSVYGVDFSKSVSVDFNNHDITMSRLTGGSGKAKNAISIGYNTWDDVEHNNSRPADLYVKFFDSNAKNGGVAGGELIGASSDVTMDSVIGLWNGTLEINDIEIECMDKDYNDIFELNDQLKLNYNYIDDKEVARSVRATDYNNNDTVLILNSGKVYAEDIGNYVVNLTGIEDYFRMNGGTIQTKQVEEVFHFSKNWETIEILGGMVEVESDSELKIFTSSGDFENQSIIINGKYDYADENLGFGKSAPYFKLKSAKSRRINLIHNLDRASKVYIDEAFVEFVEGSYKNAYLLHDVEDETDIKVVELYTNVKFDVDEDDREDSVYPEFYKYINNYDQREDKIHFMDTFLRYDKDLELYIVCDYDAEVIFTDDADKKFYTRLKFENLQDALDAAYAAEFAILDKDGIETGDFRNVNRDVIMGRSVDDASYILVKTGVTLDINGNCLYNAVEDGEFDFSMLYVTGNIIDSADTNNKGFIRFSAYMLNDNKGSDNVYMPVYDSSWEVYRLVNVAVASKAVTDSSRVQFCLYYSKNIEEGTSEEDATYIADLYKWNGDIRVKAAVHLYYEDPDTGYIVDKRAFMNNENLDKFMGDILVNAFKVNVINAVEGLLVTPEFIVYDDFGREMFTVYGKTFTPEIYGTSCQWVEYAAD